MQLLVDCNDSVYTDTTASRLQDSECTHTTAITLSVLMERLVDCNSYNC